MNRVLTTIILLLIFTALKGQYTFKGVVKNTDGLLLPAATVSIKKLRISSVADSAGMIVIAGIPPGNHVLVFSFVEHEELRREFSFPLNTDQPIEIILEKEEEHHEEEEVFINSTRTSRTIENTPTRVETISGEELDEKANMKPGDIRMLLSETTGIQTQQTSATSYNSSIRIQGLDGRYTQILKDGYPLYAGFSGGLSIMQVAPLDLKQVEVIKGSSSTLYGGGAIAGLVNLISKTPRDKRELRFLINLTSAKGTDLSGFYAERFRKTGLTVYASHNAGLAFDPAGIGLTAIPRFSRFTFNPRFFIYPSERTTINADIGMIWENRIGGSMDYIRHGTPGYFERNLTDRLTSQLGMSHRFSDELSLNVKNSVNRFNRRIEIPSYYFKGLQTSSFSEATLDIKEKTTEWIVGMNILTDKLEEEKQVGVQARDYRQNTFGVFVQSTIDAAYWLTLETGLRGDFVSGYGFSLLPRASALFRISSKLSSRLGGGFGYKAPTVFTEDAERIQFRNVLPVNEGVNEMERSLGASFDINFSSKLFGEIDFSLNHLLFYTRLNKPLILQDNGAGSLQFVNADGHIDTRGMETNLKFIYHDFKLFVGYTFSNVNTHFGGVEEWLPLTARHRLNNVLMYETDEKWKLGLEAYYFSPQKLNDGSLGRSYWITGFMAERLWEKVSVYINFENFLDTRQTKFESIYTGPVTNPVFRDIYAPVDGFVVNGGIKLRL